MTRPDTLDRKNSTLLNDREGEHTEPRQLKLGADHVPTLFPCQRKRCKNIAIEGLGLEKLGDRMERVGAGWCVEVCSVF